MKFTEHAIEIEVNGAIYKSTHIGEFADYTEINKKYAAFFEWDSLIEEFTDSDELLLLEVDTSEDKYGWHIHYKPVSADDEIGEIAFSAFEKFYEDMEFDERL